MQVVGAVLRAFQLVCAAVVLGLSAYMIKYPPSGLSSAHTICFTTAGALGIFVSIVGITALYVGKLAVVAAMLDGLCGLFFLGAGLVGAASHTVYNTLANRYYPACDIWKADVAFLFIGSFACFFVLYWGVTNLSRSPQARSKV